MTGRDDATRTGWDVVTLTGWDAVIMTGWDDVIMTGWDAVTHTPSTIIEALRDKPRPKTPAGFARLMCLSSLHCIDYEINIFHVMSVSLLCNSEPCYILHDNACVTSFVDHIIKFNTFVV